MQYFERKFHPTRIAKDLVWPRDYCPNGKTISNNLNEPKILNTYKDILKNHGQNKGFMRKLEPRGGNHTRSRVY